jgi:hypothetical protein
MGKRHVDIGKLKAKQMRRELGGPTKRRVLKRDDGGFIPDDYGEYGQGHGILEYQDMLDEALPKRLGRGATSQNPGAGIMGSANVALGRKLK